MRIIGTLLVGIVAAAVVGCGPKKPPPIPGWEVATSGRAIHRRSGVSFPPDMDNLKRSEPRVFDEVGDNGAVGYSCTDWPLEITIFVYPRAFVPGGTMEDHLRFAVSDLSRMHKDVHVERAGTLRLPLAASEVDGAGAFLTFDDQGRKLGAWVLVLPPRTSVAENVIQVRALYDRGTEGAEDGPRMQKVVDQVSALMREVKVR